MAIASAALITAKNVEVPFVSNNFLLLVVQLTVSFILSFITQVITKRNKK